MTSNAPPTTHRISEFYHWQKEHVLELAPPYQRRPVWSMKNKSFLIDTILHQYPVPEIFVQIGTDSEGNNKYVVVDGQQRIRTIIEFIDGEWEILESESPDFGGKEFKNLPQGIKRDFWDYQIVTRELKTSDEDEVVAVFTRMNKYVTPLNPQELRNAQYRGHFIQLMIQLAYDEYWIDNKIVSPNDLRRMLDVEYVSELVIAMMVDIQKKSIEGIDNNYKIYDESFAEKEDIKRKFTSVKNKINEILGELVTTRWHLKAEYYSLFIAFSQLMDKYTIPPSRYESIRNTLCKFSLEVDNALHSDDRGKSSKDQKIADFATSVVAHSSDKDARIIRTNVVRQLMIPFSHIKGFKKSIQ